MAIVLINGVGKIPTKKVKDVSMDDLLNECLDDEDLKEVETFEENQELIDEIGKHMPGAEIINFDYMHNRVEILKR